MDTFSEAGFVEGLADSVLVIHEKSAVDHELQGVVLDAAATLSAVDSHGELEVVVHVLRKQT